jgi:nitrogen fixation NifU-like protein
MEDLYSETLIDHYTHPHHTGVLKKPDVRVVRHNPLCGDTIRLDISFTARKAVKDVAFTGEGCVLSRAGMSLLADTLAGKDVTALQHLTSETMDALMGVRVSPGRRSCADLGIMAVKEALKHTSF